MLEIEPRYTVSTLEFLIGQTKEREARERRDLIDHLNHSAPRLTSLTHVARVVDHLGMPGVKWRSKDDIPVRVIWASNAIVVLVNDNSYNASAEFFESVEDVMILVNAGLEWCRAARRNRDED